MARKRQPNCVIRNLGATSARGGVAFLGNRGDQTVFSFGGQTLRFAAPYSLRRYLRVRKWQNGCLLVDADYGEGAEEDSIDLRPILRNLMMNVKRFLAPIKRVEVCDDEPES